MKVSVYVPKDLEEPLQEEAAQLGESPSMFLQSLLRERLTKGRESFSEAFVALAGSWEDSRSAPEIIQEIESSRTSAERVPLR